MDTDIKVDSVIYPNLFKVPTIRDTNSLLHGVLKASFPSYQERRSIEFRTQLVNSFRQEILECLLLPHPDYKSIEETANTVRYIYKTETLTYFANFLDCMYNFKCFNYSPTDLSKLKTYLESVLGYNLYTINSFTKNQIESILTEGSLESSKYPCNCYLYTTHLHRSLGFKNLLYFENILSNLSSENSINNDETLHYISEILEVCILIINFETIELVSEYRKDCFNKYIILSSEFEVIGLKSDSICLTSFQKDHPLVEELLLPKKSPKRSLLQKLEESLSKAEIEQRDNVFYIKYYQTAKTIYRFYIDQNGEYISGMVPDKIRTMVKNIVLSD